ncbi:50S ribosomal protein L25 [Candidatus Woesebacteria bacterium CG_4_10_14_0_2_um_filter_44_9]|uniref:Large ribosomal subunit protein bL25 n=1 Tax=Candidatus Woesebacteria bacterium CG_4_10_14_0_2_um_filter_44_9 TaxID=1975055 RepID=A0A2M7TIS1_9BACT|nr:MAG: 50S ribosomal protein L25 [Candidatus Woesebacteria bacterium CG_4_10_14_0_2_um_filter_44_9]
MDKHVLKAERRKLVGRKVKTLRREGILPANIFGKKIKSTSIQVNTDELKKVYKEVGETTLLNLQLAGEKEDRPVLIANIQKEPVSDAFIHVDFHQVDLKEKVEAKVPVELTGESPAEKQGIGTVVVYINEIEVEALPTDLPEKFTVDTSKLTEVDQVVYVKDLAIDKKKLGVKTDLESILVKVEPPQKEEVVAPPPALEGEVPSKGEAPAEGAEAAPVSEEPKPQATEK